MAASDAAYGVPASAAARAGVAILTEAGEVTVTIAEACATTLPVPVLPKPPRMGRFLPPMFITSAAFTASAIARLLTLLAVMVTVVFLVTLGAVKNPLLEIVPALADQVTAVFGLPLMRAVNCICACDAADALSGEIVSVVDELEEAGASLEVCNEPQPVKPVRQSKSDATTKFEVRRPLPR